VPEFPLTSAYWPADTSAPLLETTIGSILRDAATRAPDKVALIDGVDSGGDGAGDDGGRRRRWAAAAAVDVRRAPHRGRARRAGAADGVRTR
jgi:hypothetical protein